MSVVGRRLASGSVFRALNPIASAAASLLIMPFVVHHLGDRLFGLWALVATFSAYYGVLELGLAPAITRYAASALGRGDQEESNYIFNTGLRIFLLLATLVVAACIALAAFSRLLTKSPQDSAILWKLILILGCSMAVTFPIKVFQGMLEAHLRYDRTAALDLMSLVIRTSLFVAVLSAGFKVVGLAWASFLGNVPGMLLVIYFCFAELKFLRVDRGMWRPQMAKTLFSYAAFTFISRLAFILRFQVDSIVIATFMGLVAVTHYSIGGRLAIYFMELMIAIMGVLAPVFSRYHGGNDGEGIRRTLLFGTKIAICASSFVAFGFFAWGKAFIARWMGPTYVDAYPILVVLTIASLFFVWQVPANGLLYGTSNHKVLALLNSAEGIINLALSILLVKRYGMIGVAVGTTIPIIVNAGLLVPIYACHIAGVQYRRFAYLQLRTLLIVATSLLLPSWISYHFVTAQYLRLSILGLASLALYLIPLALVFDPWERQMVRRVIFPRLSGDVAERTASQRV